MNADKFKKLLIRTLESITWSHVTAFSIMVVVGCTALKTMVGASS
jgi:hypothetical protein